MAVNIAFDASTNGGLVTAFSQTFAHSCTGTDRCLLLGVVGSAATDNITGATYSAVTMTLIQKIALGTGGSGRYIYLFGLLAPATGSNNIVVTSNTSDTIASLTGSYTGVRQTGLPDVLNTTVVASNASASVAVTPVANRAWVVGFFKNDLDVTVIATAGTTLRVGGNTAALVDHNAAITPPVSTTLQCGPQSGATAWSVIGVSLAPVPSVSSMFSVF